MPRKAKDKEVIENEKKTVKKTSSTGTTKAKTAAKKTTASSKTATKKSSSTAPKTSTKTAASKTSKSSKTTTKKTETAAPKTTAAKKTTTKKTETTSKAKKNTTKKAVIKEEQPKKELVKKEEKVKEETVIQKIKAFIAKIVAMQEEARLEEENKKGNNKNKEIKKSEVQTPYMLEYYDLPYRYNETVVKILAQTPKRLFVYWDISDQDRQKYLLAFGERFFEETYPVLLVHNEDMNYTFEVPINDFANSWYLDIKDSKSKYTIQLGRKFREKPEMVNIVASTETESVVLHNDYVPIITSNILEVPNDHILFENVQSKVIYRNVKTGKENTIEINNLEFANKMGHIYSIYDIYKEIYKNEMDSDSLTSLLNPSSMSSSVFR